MADLSTLARLMAALPIRGGVASANPRLPRQSLNVEDRRRDTVQPTDLELTRFASDFDFQQPRMLDRRPLAGWDDQNFQLVEPGLLSQAVVPDNPVVQDAAAQMGGGGVANPGTLLSAQGFNRQFRDTAQPGRLSAPPTAAADASHLQPGSVGPWDSAYNTAVGRSDRYRPGLRYGMEKGMGDGYVVNLASAFHDAVAPPKNRIR